MTGTSTLLVLCGDHGMSDQGSHGGASQSETTTPLVLLSSRFTESKGNSMHVHHTCRPMSKWGLNAYMHEMLISGPLQILGDLLWMKLYNLNLMILLDICSKFMNSSPKLVSNCNSMLLAWGNGS